MLPCMGRPSLKMRDQRDDRASSGEVTAGWGPENEIITQLGSCLGAAGINDVGLRSQVWQAALKLGRLMDVTVCLAGPDRSHVVPSACR